MKKLYVLLITLALALAMIVPVGAVNAGSGQIEVNGTVGYYFKDLIPGNTVNKAFIVKGTICHWVVYTGDINGIAEDSLKVEMNQSTGEMPNFKGTDEGPQEFKPFSYSLNSYPINEPWATIFGMPSYDFSTVAFSTPLWTVLGKQGTFTAWERHQMRLDGTGKVELTITSGTGDLANLHGTLIVMISRQLDGSYVGTYSGKLHFAP